MLGKAGELEALGELELGSFKFPEDDIVRLSSTTNKKASSPIAINRPASLTKLIAVNAKPMRMIPAIPIVITNGSGIT
jgi:hypothetical protein